MAILRAGMIKIVHLVPAHVKLRDFAEVIRFGAHVLRVFLQHGAHHGRGEMVRFVHKHVRGEDVPRREREPHVRHGRCDVKDLLRHGDAVADLHRVRQDALQEREGAAPALERAAILHDAEPPPVFALHLAAGKLGGRQEEHRACLGKAVGAVHDAQRFKALARGIFKAEGQFLQIRVFLHLEQDAHGTALHGAVKAEIERVPGIGQHRESFHGLARLHERREIGKRRAAQAAHALRLLPAVEIRIGERQAAQARHRVHTGLQIAIVGAQDAQPQGTALIAALHGGAPVGRTEEPDCHLTAVRAVKQRVPVLVTGKLAPADPVEILDGNLLGGGARRLVLDRFRLALDDLQILLHLCLRERHQVLLRVQAEGKLHARAGLAEHGISADAALVKEGGRLPEGEEHGRIQLAFPADHHIRRDISARRGERQLPQCYRLCNRLQRFHADLLAVLRRSMAAAHQHERTVPRGDGIKGQKAFLRPVAPGKARRIGEKRGQILPLRPAQPHKQL